MNILKKLALGVSMTAMIASAAAAEISDGKVKVGVLTDMSSTYSDLAGNGSVVAAEMAIADLGRSPEQGRYRRQQSPPMG